MDAQGNYWAELSAPGHRYLAVVTEMGEFSVRFLDQPTVEPVPMPPRRGRIAGGGNDEFIWMPAPPPPQVLGAWVPLRFRGSLGGDFGKRLHEGTYRFRFEFTGMTARYGRGRKDFDRVGRVWSPLMHLIKDGKGVRVELIRRD